MRDDWHIAHGLRHEERHGLDHEVHHGYHGNLDLGHGGHRAHRGNPGRRRAGRHDHRVGHGCRRCGLDLHHDRRRGLLAARYGQERAWMERAKRNDSTMRQSKRRTFQRQVRRYLEGNWMTFVAIVSRDALRNQPLVHNSSAAPGFSSFDKPLLCTMAKGGAKLPRSVAQTWPSNAMQPLCARAS